MNNLKAISIKDKSYSKLLKKIKDKKVNTTIIGLGYVGWTLAFSMVRNGLNVNGYDIDEKKIELIKSTGKLEGTLELDDLSNLIDKNQLNLSTDPRILSSTDVVIICVPTPLKNDRITPDLSYIQKASLDIVSYCSKDTLIIIESTVYPQFTQEYFAPLLEEHNFSVGNDVFLSFSPERVNPGSSQSIDNIPKIVGGYTKECRNLAIEFYSLFISNVIPVKSPIIAEMSKLLENSYRYINIAFINEFAIQCNELNINVWDVLDAAMTKPYGYQRFNPGPGVGGHCIPIDPLYLKWSINKLGVSSKFIDDAKEINDIMPKWIVQKLMSDYFKKNGRKLENVLVLGVTYKKGVDDLRESTAFSIFRELDELSIDFMFSDPFIYSIEICGNTLKSVELNANNIKKYDAILLHTDHSQFDYEFICANANFIFDLRGKYITDSENASKILTI